jgi:hypothetical protein
MEKRRILFAASTAGFVVAMAIPAASLSGARAARPIALDDIATFPTSALPDCGPGGKPGRKKVAWVVRVVIPESFNITKLSRDIRYEPNDPNGTDDQEDDDEGRYSVSRENTTNDPEYQSNPFNIDLTPIAVRNDKKSRMYVKIRLIMKDERYKFYQFGGRHAIAYGNDEGRDMFCWDSIKQNKSGKSVAIFYVRLGEGAEFDASGLYNFALEAKDPATVPAMIVVDPKVKNSG